MPTLSICIPTYNRSSCLAELLDSIVAQDMPDLEVVISDDCSPDDTVAVAERYRANLSNLRVIRQVRNIGLDRNFLAVVEAATGDYAWLMGDDDRFEPGGARRVLEALGRWPGILGLTVGVIDYDPTMRHPVGIRAMPASQRLEGACATFSMLAEHLGFMSALVIRREPWRAVARDPSTSAFENLYVQVYIVGRVLDRSGGWGVVQEPCVGFRTSNDQFLARFGWFKRLMIDVVAYDQIADTLFGDDDEAHGTMRRRIFDTHVMARLRNAKMGAGRTPDVWRAMLFLFARYKVMRGFWLGALPTLLAPKWFIRTARTAYQRFRTSSGAGRARALGTR